MEFLLTKLGIVVFLSSILCFFNVVRGNDDETDCYNYYKNDGKQAATEKFKAISTDKANNICNIIGQRYFEKADPEIEITGAKERLEYTIKFSVAEYTPVKARVIKCTIKMQTSKQNIHSPPAPDIVFFLAPSEEEETYYKLNEPAPGVLNVQRKEGFAQ